MPTLRSEFAIEQFEEVLQRLAHKIAMEAVTNLQGDVRVVIRKGRVSAVETDRHGMAEASIKPVPRFSLDKHAKKSDRKLTDYKAFAHT
jgi:hypothetical protein